MSRPSNQPSRPIDLVHTRLEELFQECYTIRPVVHVIEGVQALLDLLCVLFILGVGGERVLGCSYSEVNSYRIVRLRYEKRLTPFTGFGGWLSGSRSTSA